MIDNYKNNLSALSRLEKERKENLFVKNINLKINIGSTLLVFLSACLFFYFFSGNLHEAYVSQVEMLKSGLSLPYDFTFIFSFDSDFKESFFYLSNIDNLVYLNRENYTSSDPLTQIINKFDQTLFFMYFKDLVNNFQFLWFFIFSSILLVKFFIKAVIYSFYSIHSYYSYFFKEFVGAFVFYSVFYLILCSIINGASNPILFYYVFSLGVSVMFFNFIFSIGYLLYFKKNNKGIRHLNLIELEIKNKNLEIKNNLENIVKDKKLIEKIIIKMENENLPKEEFDDYNKIMIVLKKIKSKKDKNQKITNDYRKIFNANNNDLEIENI